MRRLSSSQRMFTHHTLGLTALGSWNMFKGKAANTLKVLCWSSEKLAPMAATDFERNMAACLWGFAEVFHISEAAGQRLSQDEAQRLEFARRAACQGYVRCTQHCISAVPVMSSFPLKPKLHYFDKSIRLACESLTNPTWSWAFADEDFIGRIKKMAHRTHFLTVGLRCLERWQLKWWAGLRIDMSSQQF